VFHHAGVLRVAPQRLYQRRRCTDLDRRHLVLCQGIESTFEENSIRTSTIPRTIREGDVPQSPSRVLRYLGIRNVLPQRSDEHLKRAGHGCRYLVLCRTQAVHQLTHERVDCIKPNQDAPSVEATFIKTAAAASATFSSAGCRRNAATTTGSVSASSALSLSKAARRRYQSAGLSTL
jgi:hypothetical protein